MLQNREDKGGWSLSKQEPMSEESQLQSPVLAQPAHPSSQQSTLEKVALKYLH